jgi:hypothetical protein
MGYEEDSVRARQGLVQIRKLSLWVKVRPQDGRFEKGGITVRPIEDFDLGHALEIGLGYITDGNF